jgi:hypothetical protein
MGSPMRAKSVKNGFILLDLVSALGLLMSIIMIMSVAFQTLITYKINTDHMLDAVTLLRNAIDEWQHTGKLPREKDDNIYSVTCNVVTIPNIRHDVAEFVITYCDASGNRKTHTLIASSGIRSSQVLHE